MDDIHKQELLKKLWAAKAARRRELARLPIEEKWQIVLQLQEWARQAKQTNQK